jgi:hypothetical protein
VDIHNEFPKYIVYKGEFVLYNHILLIRNPIGVKI